MYMSLKWIKKLIGINALTLDFLSEKLTLAGFELETITTKNIVEDRDIILDVSFTANRTDISNIKGLVNEIMILLTNPSSYYGKLTKPLTKPSVRKKEILNYRLEYNFDSCFISTYIPWEHIIQKTYFLNNHSNSIYSSNFPNCHFLFTIKGESRKIKDSPNWIKKRLLAMNMTPVNNLIDTINYILLETGQVFVLYDLNALKLYTNTSKVLFETKFAEEENIFWFTTNEKLKLSKEILLLVLNNKPISIAGLTQNYLTQITKKTSKILLQASLFNHRQIRKSSQILNLRTESSFRLEKQFDPNSLEQAYIRLMHLYWVQEVQFKNNLIPNFNYFSYDKFSIFSSYIKNMRSKLKINSTNINKLLGPYNGNKYLSEKQILAALISLNFRVLNNQKGRFTIFVPLSRQLDLEREIDIIEEIGRVKGFNKFTSHLPKLIRSGKISKLERLKRRLKNYFIHLGFTETLHSTLRIQTNRYQPKIKNPLLTESSYLRVNLIGELLEKRSYNQKQDNSILQAFELGRVYKLSPTRKIIETDLISGIFGGKQYKFNWEKSNSVIYWFEAKGLIEEVFHKLNLSIIWKKNYSIKSRIFHPNRIANIILGKKVVGIFGQIHPKIAQIKQLHKQTFLFEFNLEIIKNYWQPKTLLIFKPYSIYPLTSCDISCIVKDTIFFNVIKKEIYFLGQPFLKSITLFDYYSRNPIPEGYHNLSFNLQFQARNKTLTNQEINPIVLKIKKNLEKKFDILF